MFLQQSRRIDARMKCPKDIQFKTHELRIGVLNQIIEEGAPFVGLKLIAVIVIAEFQAVLFFQNFSRPVEIVNRFL